MARSRKDAKGGHQASKERGTEYWSARPLSMSTPSKAVKKLTHRLERVRAKRALRKEVVAMEKTT